MTKPTLEYVFSGCRMMGFEKHPYMKDDKLMAITKDIIQKGLRKIKSHCNEFQDDFNIKISFLYNAYTETEKMAHMLTKEKYGFDNIYADSGGLQVITIGACLDDKLKKDVYKKQEPANFSMCFDEIPVMTVADKASRASVEGKMFIASDLNNCAIKSSLNAKEQITSLAHIEDNKVMYIIQGNTKNDMMRWADYSFQHFNECDIGGLAMANICIGNGSKESLEIIQAYKAITEKYKIKKQLHLLGIGSLERMKPVLNLMKSGFIDKETIVSFDSSSCSMSLMMGRLTNTNGETIKTVKTKELEKHINEFVDFFYDIFKKYYPLTKNEMANCIIDSLGSITDMLKSHDMNKSALPLLVIYNLLGFFHSVKVYMEFKDNTPVGLLRNVKTNKDMEDFERNFGYMLNSQRVFRVEHTAMEDCWV